MSKITILVGSERKGGNTAMLVEAFADGAKQNNNVKIISVSDYKVNACKGCESCSVNSKNQCCQQDDMQKIYSEMLTTDVLVIASPVYFYGISAQLKAIVDRMHTPMRNRFGIKKLALLLVAGADFSTVFDPIILQYKMILNYFKLDDAGMILVNDVRDFGKISDNPALKEAFNLGRSLI